MRLEDLKSISRLGSLQDSLGYMGGESEMTVKNVCMFVYMYVFMYVTYVCTYLCRNVFYMYVYI